MSGLAGACGQLGAMLRAPLRVPHEVAGQPLDAAVARAIARASRVRVREVLLRDGWWRLAGPPLLAALDGRPVVLRPRSGGYAIVDPSGSAPRMLDAATASRVAMRAFHFIAPAPDDMRPLALVRAAAAGTGGDWLRLAAAGLLAALVGLVIPLATGEAVSALAAGGVPPAARLGLALVAIAVGVAAFELVRTLSLIRIEAQLEWSLESAIMDRLLRLPAGFFRQFGAGDLAERVLGVTQVRHALAGALPMAIVAAAAGSVNLVLVFTRDRTLGLVAVGLAAAMVAGIALVGRAGYRRSRATAEADGRLASLGLQLVTGIGRLRVAGAQRRAFAVWMERVTALRDATQRGGQVDAVMGVLTAALPVVTTGLFFAVVAARPGLPMEAGTLTAILVAFEIFLASVLGLGSTLMAATQVLPVLERAAPLLQARPEQAREAAQPATLEGRIEARHIVFGYAAGARVLDDVTIRAEPGEMIALVGASGSGKSTVLRVLLGLERPESGSVLVDGVDLTTLDAGEVRRQLGVVMQHGRVFAGDIFSNIVGASGLDMAAAWEAARLASLEDDIRAMPMAMHTPVNEGGTTLSGGQRQRLVLARALARSPRILLLDEATSALDSRTQERVAEALAALRMTRVVVAHRVSTVRHAYRIYVLKAGRVVESGTYDELMARPGEFVRVARAAPAALTS